MGSRLKIVISPGYGAGWATWNDDHIADFMVTYPPLIEALEREADQKEIDEIVYSMIKQIKRKHGHDTYVCILAKDKLKVVEVEIPSIKSLISEFDGFESI